MTAKLAAKPKAKTGTKATPKNRVTTLQSLIWPDKGLSTDPELYFHLRGAVGYSQGARELEFGPGGTAVFNSYFNLFSLGKWVRHCDLKTLRLMVRGQGRFEVSVVLDRARQGPDFLLQKVVTLTAAKDGLFDLSHFTGFDSLGVVSLKLVALDKGALDAVEWQTEQAPLRTPDLALSITTFKREEAVKTSVARFAGFIKGSALKGRIHLQVVDNGHSAEIARSPHVTLIPNENLGGAGGFSRGLLEAKRAGRSHCLFMDDDASVHMESIERTWMFLAYATNPATAIAGALASATHDWSVWESGAVFDGLCHGMFRGTDLRDPDQTIAMELASTKPAPVNIYGGWWYFAFAIDQVKHMPFPFFVRGDDVSFSLAHDFNFVTLPGVMSFQDADFGDKESPQTLYLDLRSHLAHHLSLPSMDFGRRHAARIAGWFVLRSLVRCHYDSASALNLALEDVLRGPDFFEQNADMAARRADIKALTKTEIWGPRDPQQKPDRVRLNPHRRSVRWGMRWTLNGLLLPFFGHWGNRVTIATNDRLNVQATWGAAQITYLDGQGDTAYTVRHSKRRGFGQGIRLTRNLFRLVLRYPAVRANWQKGYARLTGDDRFWVNRLGMEASDTSQSPVAGSSNQRTVDDR